MFAKRLDVGVKVATKPANETVPGMTVVPCFIINVEEFSVAGFIASLNVTEALVLVITEVALLTGSTELIIGAVTSPFLSGLSGKPKEVVTFSQPLRNNAMVIIIMIIPENFVNLYPDFLQTELVISLIVELI